MVTEEEDFEKWADRGFSQCGDDPACWERFMRDSMSAARTPEAMENIHEAFLEHVLPDLAERSIDDWVQRYGTDLEAWEEFMAGIPDEFRETIASTIGSELRKIISEKVEETLEDPKARKMFRPYMQDLINDIVEGYLLGKTQREIASEAGYALHSIWNTTWWMRTYAGVELWP
jgi:hypothetical protein